MTMLDDQSKLLLAVLRECDAKNAELTRLRAVETAARAYFMCAVQDEAADRENCVDDKQHRLAVALKAALDGAVR